MSSTGELIRVDDAPRRREQRFVCREHGYGVKADTDGCCSTCGTDCAVVEVVYAPENWPDKFTTCHATTEEDGDGYECCLETGHAGDHVDFDNGHTWENVPERDVRPRPVPKHTGDCNVWCEPEQCYEVTEGPAL